VETLIANVKFLARLQMSVLADGNVVNANLAHVSLEANVAKMGLAARLHQNVPAPTANAQIRTAVKVEPVRNKYNLL
jgi:hypothetical protein